MDSQRFNLTHGDILGKLLFVSAPIIGTQLMLMGYNLVDMFLLGILGSDAVAASGSAGMYLWLSGGLMLVGRMGAEIGVAQRKGRRDKAGAEGFARNAVLLAAALGVLFGAACVLFPRALIAFLNIREAHVAAAAADYLFIVGFGIPAIFVASAVSGVLTGSGNSVAPFRINAAGLAVNAALDPLFIFSLDMGVAGAALATTLSQALVCLLSIRLLIAGRHRPFGEFRLLMPPEAARCRQILGWTIPVSLENLLFTIFSMIVARVIASYGSSAIAVYRIGSQTESLCWLICLGFSSGVTAFVGQNFGAGRWTRIWKGVRLSIAAIVGWGILVSVVFLTCGGFIVRLFVREATIIEMGATYLWILAFCQVFFCLESVGAGAFRGLGKTAPASIASIVSNGLRIPVVYHLSQRIGVEGVWIGITATAALRGIWVFLWFLRYAATRPTVDVAPTPSGRYAPVPPIFDQVEP